MPKKTGPLKNERYEAFVRAIASGEHKSATAAYMSVYPKASRATAKQKAYKLKQRADIQARIDELVGRNRAAEDRAKRMEDRMIEKAAQKVADRLAEKVLVTREFVIDELMDNLRRAKSGKKFDGSTANRAAELLGKEIGMFVDRSENTNTVYAMSDQPMTQEEWTAKFASDEPPADKPAGEPGDKKLN